MGIKPASLEKVKDPGVRTFIEKCISNVSERLSAKELLMDPFLQPDEDSESRDRGLKSQPPNADNSSQCGSGKNPENSVPDGSRDFTVQGQRKYHNTIFLKLRLADSSGHIRNIHFPFDIEVDTSISVASELVEELDLTDHDVSIISAMIDCEIGSHIPDWAPAEVSGDVSGEVNFENGESGARDDASPRTNDSGLLVSEILPSGLKYWHNSPNASPPLRQGPSNLVWTESVTSGESWSEENVQSPISHNDVDTSHQSSPLEASVPIDLQFVGGDKCGYLSANGSNLLEENSTRSEIDQDEIKIIVEKLEHMLEEHWRELDNLKKKHKQAVMDLLNDLPREIHHIVLCICSQMMSKTCMIMFATVLIIPRIKVLMALGRCLPPYMVGFVEACVFGNIHSSRSLSPAILHSRPAAVNNSYEIL